ncbi:dTDP-4-dehydrorhamnose 3,5-epimerase family protein [Candidatus Woesearchaeota archaeon]|jgi:dTDP-4-dehydrorhamnose 3,5-epimerase|nr:dTDP-4-dehydrorhamnose 3,5-epimerase family protein [Candidatus Woesearchaeota archaeon]
MSNFSEIPRYVDGRGWTYNNIFEGCEIKPSGQINYSILYPGIVKAWHRHTNQDDYFCIVKGNAKVCTFNPDSKSLQEYFVGELNAGIIHIPAGEWHGLMAIGNEPCGLLYYVTNKYNGVTPDEDRADYEDFGTGIWNITNQ